MGRQTVVQAILAILLFSVLPDHKKREQSDSIFFMQPFGKMNADVQKVTVPKITVFRSWSLPANDKSLADQEWKLEFNLIIKGEYSEI